jgi:hypothetical protein
MQQCTVILIAAIAIAVAAAAVAAALAAAAAAAAAIVVKLLVTVNSIAAVHAALNAVRLCTHTYAFDHASNFVQKALSVRCVAASCIQSCPLQARKERTNIVVFDCAARSLTLNVCVCVHRLHHIQGTIYISDCS